MSDVLRPGSTIDAGALDLVHAPIPPAQLVAGPQSSGHAELGTIGGVAVSVWEIGEGDSRDVEIDEIFVVLGGRATVRVEGLAQAMELRPGVVGRFAAGMRTHWSVTERLRKVYLEQLLVGID